MKTFRCPICKKEMKETTYIKIKEIQCECRKMMIRLYNPTQKILMIEKNLNKMESEK